MKNNENTSPYLNFSRKKLFKLKKITSISITEKEIKKLKKININLSLQEINKIYLPLSYLLNFYFNTHIKRKYLVKNLFNIKKEKKIPYIISISGSVAVGKSTTARILKILLSCWPEHKKIDLITTDSFLYPNKILKKKGLINHKGFPQSYNLKYLIDFLYKIKSGLDKVNIPIYSHLYYDIIPNVKKIIKNPDILIIEGLNILQPTINLNYFNIFMSDFIDFSIYVHASEKLLETWYINRFLNLCNYAKLKSNTYFSKYININKKQAIKLASKVWQNINSINLKNNILPTKERARLIIKKTKNHIVKYINLRK